ncbi:oxygenase MpaB family protein [Sphingobium sp.]|uniref:oxygenase MpaB family protein n=1 Tax=Sphingobium sp. TaxID=1912891 RepID=UPI0028BE02E2|nr:oxygenase MpaB family protein [Sphingobium sp.]
MTSAFLPATAFLRRALVRRVRAVFNDRAKGEKPVVRSSNALFPRDSVIWRVHGDVTTMMVGGVSALLLQMLHPAALAGIWDHSTFRDDMLGRLRRTARFIAVTTYADRADALAAIERVKDVHDRVTGILADGTPYSANDPHLLAWVHVTEALCFLDAWIRYGEPGMSRKDQDSYFAQFAEVAIMLGANPVPRTRAEAEALAGRMHPELHADPRTREVARMVLHQKAPGPAAMPVQRMVMEAAVDLLPRWARVMHGLPIRNLRLPAIRLSTRLVAGTIRWAFAGERSPLEK